MLARAREETGLAIVTEVMSEDDVSLVAEYADILQIGSRNMENFTLLEAAARSGRPILLKRGMIWPRLPICSDRPRSCSTTETPTYFVSAAAFALSRHRRETHSTLRRLR